MTTRHDLPDAAGHDRTAPLDVAPWVAATLLAGPVLMTSFVLLTNASGIEAATTADTLRGFFDHRGLADLGYLLYLTVIFLRAPQALTLIPHPAHRTLWSRLATAAAMATVVLQAMSLLRWFLVFPHLAATYLDPGSSPATRSAVEVVYDTTADILEGLVGIHLSYALIGFWITVLAVTYRRHHSVPTPVALAGVGIGCVTIAAEILPGTLSAVIGTTAYVLGYLWLAVIGILALRRHARSRLHHA